MNETFVHELEQRVAKYDLLCHPFYQAWSDGELTREDLREYASSYWHHVSAFPTYLSTLHARLEDAELRRTVLKNLADEEGIEMPSGQPHSDMWMDFARGFGAEAAAVKSQEPVAEVKALIGHFREQMSQSSTEEALATLWAYESQVPRVAVEKERGLVNLYGADKATCKYFTVHKTADIHHSSVWKDELQALVESNPQRAEAALNAAEVTAKKLWTALDGIERERVARKAN